jgi:hypothetical protein
MVIVVVERIALQPMALQRARTPEFVEKWAENEPREDLTWVTFDFIDGFGEERVTAGEDLLPVNESDEE